MINSSARRRSASSGCGELDLVPRRADGGHRARRDRPGHRGLLRGRRGRRDRRAPRPDHRPAAREGRRAARRARRRHRAARRPRRLRDRLHPGRAVPARRRDAARLLDERGNFLLYRQIRPVDVARTCTSPATTRRSSARSTPRWPRSGSRPTWPGAVALPDPRRCARRSTTQLAFMDDATDRHHCRGTKIIPFSLHNVDEVLGDLGPEHQRRGPRLALAQPVDPAAYRRRHAGRPRRLPPGRGHGRDVRYAGGGTP